MSKAVQLSAYGGVDQLNIVEVAKPAVKAGEVLVRVVAAGTNPGEISIREGLLRAMYPREFPFGQGTDFAGRVDSIGAGVSGFAVGDDVFGWTDQRAAQAEFVASNPAQLLPKPLSLDWFRAGSLAVVAMTAVAGVRAVAVKPGDVVAVSGAAGGVGSLAIQLAKRAGARVIGIASAESAPFLGSVGVEAAVYGDGLAERVRALAPNGIDAFIDLFGGSYIELAVSLGVAHERINSLDFVNAKKYGVKNDGMAATATRETLASVADLIAWGEIILPLTAIYPLALVRDAYTELARRKAHGKIVLALEATSPLRNTSRI